MVEMSSPTPEPPDKLYETIIRMVKAGDYASLGIYLIILYLPFIIAAAHTAHSRRKIEKLYKERLSDKDAEIQRQAARIKELESVLLKRQRK